VTFETSHLASHVPTKKVIDLGLQKVVLVAPSRVRERDDRLVW